jgi:autotransporter-associated beta strand protein
MRTTFAALAALACLASAERLLAHGFALYEMVNGSDNVTGVTVVSNQPVLDQDGVTPGPDNLFLDNFFIQTSGSNDGDMGTYEGGPQIVGGSVGWSGAYFTIVSPLFYSDGTGTAAVPAVPGTWLNFFDRYPNNSDGLHPGASAGNFNLTGSAATGGFAISLYDFHEVEKDLVLSPASSQTYGEYGYAFDVTIPFDGGSTYTIGPLVNVFGTGTKPDPDNPGGFSNATDAQQDAATQQVYDAVMAAAPEPSTAGLAAAGAVVFGLAGLRRLKPRRRGRFALRASALCWGLLWAAIACGHGFNIEVNTTGGTPSSLSVFSQEQYFDNVEVPSSMSPENMFIEEFSASPTTGTLGTYYSVLHGFCATAGPAPSFTATFNVVSPLYFSSGLPCGANPLGPVVAQPASPGTFMNIYDLWAGNPEPVTDPHPGASFGNVILTGTTTFAPGFGVSLTDPHELEHDLYLSATSTQTYGEYGFAYTVTMHFSGTNATLTTPPLVDVYAVSDPNLGDFPDYAPYTQQDAASVAIYQVATRSNAPSWAAATSGSWNNPANWSNWPGNGVPGSPPTGAGLQVAIGAATTMPLTISLDAPQTVGALIFGNSASNTTGYTISAGTAGTLTLDNLTAGAEIDVTGGSHAISANVVLADNLWIAPRTGTALVISGNVSQSSAAEAMTLSGPGTLVLSGSNSFTGGTYVAAGTLEVVNPAALPDGSSVAVGADTEAAFAAIVPDGNSGRLSPPALYSSPSIVPEPGTPALLLGACLMSAGGCLFAAYNGHGKV